MTGVGFRAHVKIASRIVSYRNSLSRPKNRLRARDLAAVWGRNCKFFLGGEESPQDAWNKYCAFLHRVSMCSVCTERHYDLRPSKQSNVQQHTAPDRHAAAFHAQRGACVTAPASSLYCSSSRAGWLKNESESE